MHPQDLTPDLKVAIRVAAELFNHSYRVKQYLHRIGPGESQEHRQLVDTLRRALEHVERQTITSLAALWDIPRGDESRDQAVAHLQYVLRRFSRYFTAIHELLAYLPRESIGPEAVFALEGCFLEFVQRHRPSVVLGSVVNAFEFDFIDILKETLADIGDIFSPEERVFVFQLAICDADSPLAYPILGHEVGHALDSERQISSHVVDEFLADVDADREFRQMLLDWCGELCADMVASRALGPAAILSLLSMEYCIHPEYAISMHSDTHPSTRTRLQVLRRDMEESGAFALIGSEVEFYESAWRLNLERAPPDDVTPQQKENWHDDAATFLILPMAELLRQRLSSLDGRPLPTLKFDEESLKRCVERLGCGAPVSAQGKDREPLQQDVRAYRDRRFDSQEARREAFKELCAKFAEKPLEIPKILLSGHLYRAKLLENLYNDDQPLGSNESVTSFCESLAHLDATIGSSIVTACVHQEVLQRLQAYREKCSSAPRHPAGQQQHL